MTSDVAASLARALRGAYLRRSIGVALVVGTILNLINQWGAWVGAAPIVWPKLLLTYCVPFFVATYGTFSAIRGASREWCPATALSALTDTVMKRVLFGVVGVLVIVGGVLYAFREPLMQAAMDRMTAHMFIARGTDSYDPGLAVGQAFPTIHARFQDHEITDMGSFMGKRGMVVYVNRSVDW